MQKKITLEDLRNQINDIDQKILALLTMRANVALEVGKIKRADNQDPIFYRPEREAQILRDMMAHNQGPLHDEDIANIYRAILSAGRAIQQPLSVAFLGPEGTFSHSATLKHFGESCTLAPVSTIEQIFKQVSSRQTQYGIVPIENTTEGIVNPTLDAFIDSAVKICGEVELNIHQNLLVKDPNATIKRIYSHTQSLGQCRQWLNQHYPNVDLIAVNSNAQAAKIASEQPNTAAIASQLAAKLYQLETLQQNIEDNPDNITRFWVIGLQEALRSGNDKTSLLINTTNIPGAFANIMQPFAKHQVNITLFESRPHRKRSWHYVFFLDIEGHQEDAAIKKALDELSKYPHLIQILGSYPKMVTAE